MFTSLAKFLNLRTVRVPTLFLVVFSGLLVAFVSQASSPDYRRLFWGVFPVALVHFGFVALYLTCVRGWCRWGAAVIGFIAGCSFLELALRLWS